MTSCEPRVLRRDTKGIGKRTRRRIGRNGCETRVLRKDTDGTDRGMRRRVGMNVYDSRVSTKDPEEMDTEMGRRNRDEERSWDMRSGVGGRDGRGWSGIPSVQSRTSTKGTRAPSRPCQVLPVLTPKGRQTGAPVSFTFCYRLVVSRSHSVFSGKGTGPGPVG